MDKDKVNASVWFREWAQTLDHESVEQKKRKLYRQTILGYLHFCKSSGQPASIASARAFVENKEKRESRLTIDKAVQKEALNWFFKHASSEKSYLPNDVPPLAKVDMGETDWERKMIRRIRNLHLQWRTEQTYRGWAWRFAGYLGSAPSFSEWDSEILAYFSRKIIVDLGMAGDGRSEVLCGVAPPGMASTFANEGTTMLTHVPEQFLALHTVTSSSV